MEDGKTEYLKYLKLGLAGPMNVDISPRKTKKCE